MDQDKMEKWNEISYNLSEKKNISEDKFELIIIQMLGLLGWKKYLGDLDIQPVFKSYHGKSKRMDILAKLENKNAFVIEVKKPSLQIINDHILQLKEYMRFLKLDLGLLFGEKIQIYYDGNLLNNKDFILLDEIEYKINNPKGLEFVELFEKDNFNEMNITNYIKSKLYKIQNKKSIIKLKTDLQNKENLKKIKEIIKKEFSLNYNNEVLDEVFKNLKINIKFDIKESQELIIKNEKFQTGITASKSKISKKEALLIINEYLKNINQPKINSKNTTYSNKNKSNDKWWFEPKPDLLKEKFNIVLNDYKTKTLFLFEIPKNQFNPPDNFFYFREKDNRYSITIKGNDLTYFEDELGKLNIKFRKYLKHSIKY